MKKINSRIHFVFILVGFIVLSCHDELANESPVSIDGNSSTAATSSKGIASRIGDISLNNLVGDPISLETAKAWTANYRSKYPEEIKAHFFGSEIINKILAQSDCIGMRMYYAIDDNGGKQIILVGVDSNGNNMEPTTLELNLDDPNTIADISYPCPSFCPPREF